MAGPGRIEFLERDSYRQRRFRDAARILPVFAVIMMGLPLMWPRAQSDQSLTSSGMIYLFGLWIGLIVLAFILSRVLRFTPPPGAADNAASDLAAGAADDTDVDGDGPLQ